MVWLAGSVDGRTSRIARDGIEGVDDNGDDVVMQDAGGTDILTWRPARAEWLCCFLGPSVADVFPPELLPPEDLPFPPAIVMMFVLCRSFGAGEELGFES